MTTFGFGVVTASYTLGGFASSVLTGRLADAKGRKQTALYSAWLIVLVGPSSVLCYGKLSASVESSFGLKRAGRCSDDFRQQYHRARHRKSAHWSCLWDCDSAGTAVPQRGCSARHPRQHVSCFALARPNEELIVSFDYSGVLTQLSICFGILLAQSISSKLSAPTSRRCEADLGLSTVPLSEVRTGKWRLITMVSMAIALLQVCRAFPEGGGAPSADRLPPLFPNRSLRRPSWSTARQERTTMDLCTMSLTRSVHRWQATRRMVSRRSSGDGRDAVR